MLTSKKKLIEVERELNNWSKRNLTPLGKIVVIKLLIISKIVHILISLPTPSEKLIKHINDMLYSFLWNDKPDKLKRKFSKQKLVNGGIGMIDLKAFDQSLKLTWVRKLFNSESCWKSLIDLKYPEFLDILKFGNVYVDTISTNVRNPFWNDVLNALSSFTKQYYKNYNGQVDTCSFLYNEKKKVGNTVIKCNELANNGIFMINQLKEEDRFLNFQEFRTKFNVRIYF